MPFALLLALLQSTAPAAPVCAVRSGPVAVPLVELYTSEGCSSCPPADRWFARQVGRTDATWLAFHVDYWDALGWPDRFASAAFTRRQHQRVAAWASDTVYTPQVMVGPDIHAPWRGSAAFEALLQKGRAAPGAGLALQAHRDGDAWRVVLGVAADAHRDPSGQRVWVARYVDGQVTAVGAGENRGAELRHEHVVRALLGGWPLAPGTATHAFAVPAGEDGGLVAFVQDDTGRTWQSLALPFAMCATPR
jgi:hypothetical protein